MPTTAADIRSTLVDALQIDLVGPTPTDSEHAEEVLTQAPSKWYLTGFLAPFGAKPDDRSDDEGDAGLEEVGESETGEDSQTPEKAPARKALFPASMGLSFLITPRTKELKATVSWGDYIPIALEEESPDVQESDDKKKQKSISWQRIPQAATFSIPIEPTADAFEIDIPGGSGLTLVVNCRPVHDHRFETGTLSVSTFLMNYRQMQLSEKDTTFAFQTCLMVHCKEGFVPRSDLRGVDSDDWDEAVAASSIVMTVGHNVSAVAHLDADNSQGAKPSLCNQVCTTWIPTASVPRVVAATIQDVKLGMEALATAASADAMRQMLNPT